jgi:hypothetical protein
MKHVIYFFGLYRGGVGIGAYSIADGSRLISANASSYHCADATQCAISALQDALQDAMAEGIKTLTIASSIEALGALDDIKLLRHFRFERLPITDEENPARPLAEATYFLRRRQTEEARAV